MKSIVAAAFAVMLVAACGSDPANPLVVAWKFEGGDCSSNKVDKVQVTVTSEAGGEPKQSEAACADGKIDFGVLEAGSYGIHADGLDGSGKIVAADFGTSTTFGERGPFGDLEVTLHPKAAEVVVTWSMSSGSGCPQDVVLPYYIAIYRPPETENGPLTDKVTEVQESCASKTATIPNVAPGSYVVELDSRAVTPKIEGRKPVTVEPGTNAAVDFQF